MVGGNLVNIYLHFFSFFKNHIFLNFVYWNNISCLLTHITFLIYLFYHLYNKSLFFLCINCDLSWSIFALGFEFHSILKVILIQFHYMFDLCFDFTWIWIMSSNFKFDSIPSQKSPRLLEQSSTIVISRPSFDLGCFTPSHISKNKKKILQHAK